MRGVCDGQIADELCDLFDGTWIAAVAGTTAAYAAALSLRLTSRRPALH